MNLYILWAQVSPSLPVPNSFDSLGFLLRSLHILAAVLLAGGVMYQRLILLPGLKAEGTDPAEFFTKTRAPWAKWVGICALVLIVTGLINFILIVRGFNVVRPYYHMFFGLKFLLALAIIFIASVFAGRRSLADKFRANASFWLSLNLLLVVILLLLASAMRIMPKEPKSAETVAPSAKVSALE